MSVLRLTPEQVAAHQARVKRLPKVPEQATAAPNAAGANKYHNVVTDGYHSKREAERAKKLKLMQRAGEISELQEQVKYTLIPRQNDANGKCLFRAVTYTLDFKYMDGEGRWRHEDAKGYPNDRWPMKKALMYWVHGVIVEEV